MLEPLKQYLCDECGQVIEKPEDGWVEWLYDTIPGTHEMHHHSYRIVHHQSRSPLRRGCYAYTHHENRCDNHLHYILAYDLLPPHARNIWEYVGFVRRLTVPHFEEARQYLHLIYQDKDFAATVDYNRSNSTMYRDIIHWHERFFD